MPPQNNKLLHTKHRHSNKLSPYTKSKSNISSKKVSKKLKHKNKSLINELDDLAAGDLLYNTTTNKLKNNDDDANNKGIKNDDIELLQQHNDEKLVLDIENTLKELENFVVKE